jgi:PcRGLX-like N-terminal RIFT barrel domain
MKIGVAQLGKESLAKVPFEKLCPIILQESLGVSRTREPMTMGIPFPVGMVVDSTQLVLLDQDGHPLLFQIQVLSRWSDGSVKWALFDFFATVGPHQTVEYSVVHGQEGHGWAPSEFSMIRRDGDVFTVDTGKVSFDLSSVSLKPFEQVVIDGLPYLSQGKSALVLTDDAGKEWDPRISAVEVEASGPVRATLKIDGSFFLESSGLAHFIARLSFFRESGLVEFGFTLRNSRAACHPGGLWDLGDAGSIFFRDLSLQLALPDSGKAWTKCHSNPLSSFNCHEGSRVQVYQDSSGGKNWKSTNHVNRLGQVMNAFPGYRVMMDDSVVEEGNRATPVIRWENGNQCVSATIDGFWQNFPKALESNRDQITLRLFPHHFNDVFELQGGEQKTHKLFLCFEQVAETQEGLGWVHAPLMARSDPEWYARSKAISYLLPRSHDKNGEYLQLIDSVITGQNTFFDRREIIDEYGWRNFGEVYADHEAVGCPGPSPRVSHYNNQYDVINGLLIEFLRTGDHRWNELAQDLARHVIDIDVYHTKEDRPAYNGGMFWHTDHYFDASTGTHRAFSRANKNPDGLQDYGGGPSNEHNYSSGLLLYYFLTGDSLAYEVVEGLADWVINMDQRRSGILGLIDRRPRGLASSSTHRDYHGPGRGGGNSINALLDGYRLTQNPKYLFKAEELIRRCIHPHDRIEERNLTDIEYRWSYLVFLQVLGTYLDFKIECHDLDEMYGYAKASLLHYAEWMVKNEVPYKQVLDRVEIPTETWSAQDIRKSNVCKFAAKHADDTRRLAFLQKADFFFSASVSDLLSFKTCQLTRPLVLMVGNGFMHAYFQVNPGESAPVPLKKYTFGRPRAFVPQLHEIYKLRDLATSVLGIIKRMMPFGKA